MTESRAGEAGDQLKQQLWSGGRSGWFPH